MAQTTKSAESSRRVPQRSYAGAEIVSDLADGSYKEDGYPAHAFETWARLHAFLEKEGVPDAREVAKNLTLEQPWFEHGPYARPDEESLIPF